MEEKITKLNIHQFIGKILLKENENYKWMFKVVDVDMKNNILLVTNPLDISPRHRFYLKAVVKYVQNENNFFYDVIRESLLQTRYEILRTPTKNELLEYINYTREQRLLNNESILKGEKIYSCIKKKYNNMKMEKYIKELPLFKNTSF